MDQHPKSLEFMQIAMKHFPEAKEQLEKFDVEITMDMVQPLIGIFSKVMAEAYELGKADGERE
ncbi:ComZ family protein [Bacillus carboniphilus]|uniref:ComZ family protein n=1 Tax=Bacillus carboniphilus TaxID=86663 RepID=A0ABY9JU62_9BACI|nr:ComZ family protein [Bacillus carboniphilus]WLR42939.1 ComZ family protein [Bacillus carboniphilus]